MGGPLANGTNGGDVGSVPGARTGLRARLAGLNHNVLLTGTAKALNGVAGGIWATSTIATYLFMIEDNSNTAVGIAQGVMGVFGAASGVPAGFIADRTRRDKTLRGFGIVQLAAVATTVVALLLPVREVAVGGRIVDSQYLIILASMVLWGISMGATPVMDAILADSVKSGGRTGVYTVLYAITILAMAVGQFVAAGVFVFSGNRWTVESLKVVMLVGQAISLVPAFTLFLFDDDKALGEESDPLMGRPVAPPPGTLEEGGASAASRAKRGWGDISFVLPLVLTSAGGLFGVAAGMTVKFFPIFFKEAVMLSPGATNLIMAVTPLALAGVSFFAQAVSSVLGRIQTVIMFQAMGVSLLFVMGLFPSIWTVGWLILPVYILRTVCNNCCYAIIRSLLMDYVPKETRGRWNSTDNIMQLGWSGSAVLGGFLLDRYSFDGTFLITASVQAFAWSLQLPLLVILPPHEAHHASALVSTDSERQLAVEGAVEGTAAAASPIDEPLTTPLLQSPALENGEAEHS